MRNALLLLLVAVGCSSSVEQRVQERELEMYIEREAANRLQHHTPGPVTFQSVRPERTHEDEAYFIEHGVWPAKEDFPIDL